MEDSELARATWRKASRSQGNGACVEVANPRAGRVAVRDSKDVTGPAVVMTGGQWREFLARTLLSDPVPAGLATPLPQGRPRM